MTAALLLLLLLAPSGRCDDGTCGTAPAGGLSWNYQDTSSAWAGLDGSSCGPSTSVQQSPVDLSAATADCGSGARRPRVKLNSATWRARVANNGRTLNVVFDCLRQPRPDGCDGRRGRPDGPITLRYSRADGDASQGAHETVEYDLSELHLHWCSGDSDGSEHTLGGQRSAAEVHFKFKHWDRRGRPFQEALVEPGALHAVGILLDEGDGSRPMAFPSDEIQAKIHRAQAFNAGFNIKALDVKPLHRLLKKALKRVYKYVGSLTTPPCTLGLPWLVSAERGTISSSFLGQLRQLQDEDGNPIACNVRPLQDPAADLDLCLFEHS